MASTKKGKSESIKDKVRELGASEGKRFRTIGESPDVKYVYFKSIKTDDVHAIPKIKIIFTRHE